MQNITLHHIPTTPNTRMSCENGVAAEPETSLNKLSLFPLPPPRRGRKNARSWACCSNMQLAKTCVGELGRKLGGIGSSAEGPRPARRVIDGIAPVSLAERATSGGPLMQLLTFPYPASSQQLSFSFCRLRSAFLQKLPTRRCRWDTKQRK